MGCGDVRLLRTIGGVDFTGQESAALNNLTMPVFEVAVANERGQILDRKRYGQASFQRFLETRPPLA